MIGKGRGIPKTIGQMGFESGLLRLPMDSTLVERKTGQTDRPRKMVRKREKLQDYYHIT